jgi:hypothetical protein
MKVEDLLKSFMLLATMLEPNRKIWQSFTTKNENLKDLTSRKQKKENFLNYFEKKICQ